MAEGLSHRQELFVAAYLEGEAKGNATAAAAAAGYRHPGQLGERQLKKVQIAARIADHERAVQAAVRDEGIANRQNRIDAQNARWRALHTIVEERAAAHHGQAPGASTGYMVRTVKFIRVIDETSADSKDGATPEPKRATRSVEVEEWAIDAALLAEFRQLEQHSAKESGQWDDMATLTLVPKALIGVDLDRV
jgi:hypothetical protein